MGSITSGAGGDGGYSVGSTCRMCGEVVLRTQGSMSHPQSQGRPLRSLERGREGQTAGGGVASVEEVGLPSWPGWPSARAGGNAFVRRPGTARDWDHILPLPLLTSDRYLSLMAAQIGHREEAASISCLPKEGLCASGWGGVRGRTATYPPPQPRHSCSGEGPQAAVPGTARCAQGETGTGLGEERLPEGGSTGLWERGGGQERCPVGTGDQGEELRERPG